MKVLVIGSGARRHAIAHALMRGGSVSKVTVAPGNPGMELGPASALRSSINTNRTRALVEFMKNSSYDRVFVGRNAVDRRHRRRFRRSGIRRSARIRPCPDRGAQGFRQATANVDIPTPQSIRRWKTTWTVPRPTCANTVPRSSRLTVWLRAKA